MNSKNNDKHFIESFRHSAPYIHAHRDRTVVLAFGGEAVASVVPLAAEADHALQAALLHEGEQFLNEGDAFDGHVITIQVMAVADMSAAHQHPVGALLERLEDMVGGDRARAHDPDGSDVGRIAQAADAGQVGSPEINVARGLRGRQRQGKVSTGCR